MDLSSFSTLSVEERQAIDALLTKTSQERVEKERAAARGNATATTEEEEGTKGGAQAHRARSPGAARAHPKPTHCRSRLHLSRTMLFLPHRQPRSTSATRVAPVRPTFFYGCFKQGEDYAV